MARVMQLNKVAYDQYLEQQEVGCSKDEGGPDGADEDAEDLEAEGDLESGRPTLFSQITRIYDGSRTPYNYTILQSAYRVRITIHIQTSSNVMSQANCDSNIQMIATCR